MGRGEEPQCAHQLIFCHPLHGGGFRPATSVPYTQALEKRLDQTQDRHHKKLETLLIRKSPRYDQASSIVKCGQRTVYVAIGNCIQALDTSQLALLGCRP
jgi:hypothetical protein